MGIDEDGAVPVVDNVGQRTVGETLQGPEVREAVMAVVSQSHCHHLFHNMRFREA